MAAETLREGAYTGGSRMAAPWPDRSQPLPERPAPAPADEPDGQGDEPDEPDEPDDDEDQGDEPDAGRPSLAAPAGVQDGAGWLLGLAVWGLVVLPFLKGGPERVKQTLMAKFFNRAADGSWLP